MKRPLKITLKALAILAVIAAIIALGPGWGTLIGTLAIIIIVVVGLVVDHIAEKNKWPPFGGPWPRRRRDDEDVVPQLTERVDNEATEERKEPQAR